MELVLSDSLKKKYLNRIKADFNYFKKSLERADLQINIENVPVEMIPDLIIEALGKSKIQNKFKIE
jgi:hypothetical protein